MHVYYDRDADTNLSEDSARAWRFVTAAVCAIAAVAIWAGWLVMMRVGVTTTLTAFDLTALRFVVAGVVLLPVIAVSAPNLLATRLAEAGVEPRLAVAIAAALMRERAARCAEPQLRVGVCGIHKPYKKERV
jgi:hypothetical protein